MLHYPTKAKAQSLVMQMNRQHPSLVDTATIVDERKRADLRILPQDQQQQRLLGPNDKNIKTNLARVANLVDMESNAS